jgi:hypothetical protein
VFAVLIWLLLRVRPACHAWPVAAGSLLLALAATIAGFDQADRSHGLMWPQVLAALAGYGVFLLALGLGGWLPARHPRR